MGWLDVMIHGAPAPLPRLALESDPRIVPEFAETYRRHITPRLLFFEHQRVNTLAAMRKRALWCFPLGIAIIIGTIAVLITYTLSKDASEGVLWGGGAAALAAFCYPFLVFATYKKQIKSELFPLIFKHFGEDFEYDQRGRMNPGSLRDHYGIVPSYSTAIQSDYVSGSHKGVPLELEEMMMERGHGKHRKTVFRGLMVRVGVSKNFNSKTLIRRDGGSIGNWIQEKGSKLERVRLEDPAFETRYEVFGDNQVEARYLLTTTFMERLMQLEDLFRCKLQASFYNKSLLIMIPSSRQWFEPGSIYEPATFVEDINQINEQMQSLFQIIEVLNLDDTTRL